MKKIGLFIVSLLQIGCLFAQTPPVNVLPCAATSGGDHLKGQLLSMQRSGDKIAIATAVDGHELWLYAYNNDGLLPQPVSIFSANETGDSTATSGVINAAGVLATGDAVVLLKDDKNDVSLVFLKGKTRKNIPLPSVLKESKITAMNITSFGSIVIAGFEGNVGYVALIDVSGKLIWQEKIGGLDEYRPAGLSLAAQNNILLSGWYKDNLMGAEMGFVAQYSINGKLISQKTIGNPDRNQRISQSALDEAGQFLFAGTVAGKWWAGRLKPNLDIEWQLTGEMATPACIVGEGKDAARLWTVSNGVLNCQLLSYKSNPAPTPVQADRQARIAIRELGPDTVFQPLTMMLQKDSIWTPKVAWQRGHGFQISAIADTTLYLHCWGLDTKDSLRSMCPAGLKATRGETVYLPSRDSMFQTNDAGIESVVVVLTSHPNMTLPEARSLFRPRKSIIPKPVPVEPKPDPVKPKPTPVEPKPDPVEPKPDPVKPKPTPVEPKPDPVKPKPEPVKPKPDPVKPTPVEPKPTTKEDNKKKKLEAGFGFTTPQVWKDGAIVTEVPADGMVVIELRFVVLPD